jgi:Holliday junction resolvase RusA-like endonuclease
MVRMFGQMAMENRQLFEGPLALSVGIVMQPPKSWSRKRRECTAFPTGKPDLDNVAKLIGDSLNGVVWRDDAQISLLQIQRTFGCAGEGERVEIGVRELEQAP